MRIGEYVRSHDALATEAPLFDIPMRKEYILKEIGRGKRVLDLGCHGGQISKLIKDQNNDVYGVELNAKAAAEAEKRGIRVRIFDLNDGIPFEDGYFDAVHAGDIVEHIYDTKFLFQECNRVLKNKGTLLFSTLNLNSLSNRMRVLTGGYLNLTGAFPEDHRGEKIRVFNLAKIQELCEHTGFRVLDVSGVPDTVKESVRFKVMRPLVKVMPQLAELLLVKARKIEND